MTDAPTLDRSADEQRAPQAELTQTLAGPMGNCLYRIADPATRKAFIFDPAWIPLELYDQAIADGLAVEGVVLTHTHQDHVGGSLFGQSIPGLRELIEAHPDLPVWVHESEAAKLLEITGIPEKNVRILIDEQNLQLGELDIRCIHCPGHSPGGVAFLVDGNLIAGDTLFVQGVGRVDLPGSDPDALFYSLRRLIELPDATRVFPGHGSPQEASSTIGREKELNPYLRPTTVEQWRIMMGIF